MATFDKKIILEQFIFEIVERITRFSSHLEEIKAQFYNDEDSIVRDKLIFISSYEDCLLKYFQLSLSYLKIINNDENLVVDTYLNKLESVLLSVNQLHETHLVHLPRPNEPMELRRFGRVIKKQVFNIGQDSVEKDNSISIYINEEIGEVSYATDPLQKFKLDNINSLVFEFNNSINSDNAINGALSIEEFRQVHLPNVDSSIHITISRIDSSNPCHWPSLLHEVSHKLMQKEWFDQDDIYTDFENYLKQQDADEHLNRFIGLKIDIRSWLTECWCDLFACASMGPSFYFSQYHSFLNYLKEQKNEKYPPFLFRLKLIEKILYHRFKSVFKKEDLDQEILLTQSLLSYFEKNQNFSFDKDKDLRKIFQLFKEYFLDHLFKAGEEHKIVLNNVALNAKFQKTVKYVNEIVPEKIIELAQELENGLPIPGYIDSNDTSPIDRPNSVQEILFAAWVYRNKSFKKSIIDALKEYLNEKSIDDIVAIKDLFKENISKRFIRFDQSILRSVQVSEYFDTLFDDATIANPKGLNLKKRVENKSHDSLLVDWEILSFLRTKSIRVIPVMSLKEQLGSTSLDIRLGSTFELYLPNQFGILDFTEKESIKNISKSAQRINLDYLDSIAINPGQFVLGHSMEYVKLDDNISADLEGRSSFARLGIEIHMTAGFIDPGFEGVLTFEIFNAGPSPVKLYPGLRIGQLRFTKTEVPDKSYRKKHTAKYAGLLEYNSSKQNKDYEIERIMKDKLKSR